MATRCVHGTMLQNSWRECPECSADDEMQYQSQLLEEIARNSKRDNDLANEVESLKREIENLKRQAFSVPSCHQPVSARGHSETVSRCSLHNLANNEQGFCPECETDSRLVILMCETCGKPFANNLGGGVIENARSNCAKCELKRVEAFLRNRES